MSGRVDILRKNGARPQDLAIQPVIGLALDQSKSQGIYVYEFDAAMGAALVASAGPAPCQAHAGLTSVIDAGAVSVHRGRTTPIVLRDGAYQDWRFASLPEFQANRFEGVISVPLTSAASVVGMANFCRIESSPITPAELTLLLNLNEPLAALLSASTLREELERTLQRLAERKVLDRAKGLLQASNGWTEKEAYMHIRLMSRRTRIPMRNVAERLIQNLRGRLEATA